MSRRMINRVGCTGYILGDMQFDANRIDDQASEHGAQLVAPRQRGQTRGLGSRCQAAGRLRSKDLLEKTVLPFGRTRV
jgi:hypothetical protein